MNVINTERSPRLTIKWPIYLVILSISLTVVFYVFLLMSSNSSNERSSKIYEQSLVASINQYEYLPALLSTDELFIDVLTSPLQHVDASEKLHFIAQRAGADTIYIMDIAGNVVATSNYQSNNSFLNKNYNFRPYFQKAITEKKRQFYYAKGVTTGIPGFFISNPIISDSKIIGVAVVKLTMDYWEKNWNNSAENIITADENGIIILSSKEEWRYKAIGPLSPYILANIHQQQQFLGGEHHSIYNKTFKLSFFKATFWLIDKKLYISHRFPIPEINWTLYSLVDHNSILFPTIIFFLVISTLSLSFYLIQRERKHRLESIYKHQQLELNREEELKAVIDNIYFGVTLFSTEGELLSINDYGKRLLFNGAIPDPNKRLFIDEIINVDFEHLDELLIDDTSSSIYHETYAFSNNTEIPVMFALSKVMIMDVPLYLMTIINISRRKKAEQELVKINNSLEETIAKRTEELQKTQATLMKKNKAAALGNMAATIVHELSQPLAAMNSSIAAVCAKIDNNDWRGATDSAERLNHLSNKMYNVIKLLKYFSYPDGYEENIIDLAKTVEESLDIFKDTITEKNIELSFQSQNDTIEIKANPIKLELIITNIIKNSIDVVESVATPKIHISVQSSINNTASIIITDNGGGVDEDIMKNMFNPYFTTKEVGKGLGLGLSITYEIIQEYNGSITVNNTIDGARFFITLPQNNLGANKKNHYQDVNTKNRIES